jgi:hypothetical protein
MSTPATPECFPCPHCNAANVLEPVSVVRGDDKEALEALFRGDLNKAECQNCEKPFLYESPLLFRDDETRRLIYFVPESMCEDRQKAIDHVTELESLVLSDLEDNERPVCRLTTDRRSLIEKIAVLRNDLDDRLIEYVKYQLFQHSDGLDHNQHQLLFDFANASDEYLAFLCFDRKTGKPSYALQFEIEDYAKLAEWFLGEGAEQLDRLFPNAWVQVDELFLS